MATDDLNDLARMLRSELSSTELVLARFSQAFRKHVVLAAGQPASPIKPDGLSMAIDLIGKAQGDFAKYKATMDLFLAFFPE